MITRKGYNRKGYTRKGYTRSDGTKVKKSYVPPTYVPPSKIKDRGLPGKGPKIIDMTDERHLGKFGFSLKNSTSERHASENAAVEANGYAWVIRRLNAIRTLLKNTEPQYTKKITADMEYLHNKYR